MAQALDNLLQQLGIVASADALTVIVAVFAFILGAVCARLWASKQRKQIQADFVEKIAQERASFDDQLDQLSHTFSSLSQQALQHNNESFLTLAKQSFAQLQSNASNDLKAREQSFANLLQPIQRSILKRLDQDRIVTETKLGEQINNLLSSQHLLQSETRNLVTALRRPEVRGQWGELTLKRLVELAGMSEHCDFSQQVSVQTEQGILRPDMLIRLPSDRLLVVDVKTPLDAYISATEATKAEHQQSYLKQHSQNVKQRIKELAQKQYWQQFEQSPDFVILFIPGDQFLSAALDQDKTLLEFALQQRILLATPTSLVGLLRAVAYGWSQQTLSKNAEEIRALGEALFQRLQTLTEHLNKLGKNLDQSVSQFNKVIGSYQSKTIPAARKLSALGISSQSTTDVEPAEGQPTRRLQDDTQ